MEKQQRIIDMPQSNKRTAPVDLKRIENKVVLLFFVMDFAQPGISMSTNSNCWTLKAISTIHRIFPHYPHTLIEVALLGVFGG